jgi:hypothetical protein
MYIKMYVFKIVLTTASVISDLAIRIKIIARNNIKPPKGRLDNINDNFPYLMRPGFNMTITAINIMTPEIILI